MEPGSLVVLVSEIPQVALHMMLSNKVTPPKVDDEHTIQAVIHRPNNPHFKVGLVLVEYPDWLIFNAAHWREVSKPTEVNIDAILEENIVRV